MTTSDHMPRLPRRSNERVSLDELAARKGVRPVMSMDDLACDVFDTDEELDAFLADTYAARHADLG
ncbi:MAG: hypothetical protein ACRDQA_28405 [Nocardioidaceae bacterium]